MNHWKRIGAQIEARRQAKGWSMARLGEQVGASRQHINDIEKGRAKCSVDRLQAIAAALGCRLEIKPKQEQPE